MSATGDAAARPIPAFLLLLISFQLLSATPTSGDGDYLLNGEKHDRIKRDGEVSVLSLQESGPDGPVGVLSSTARTFVAGGATTEYVTQVLGTTVGRTYAKLLSSTTRVYYGNQGSRPTNRVEQPFLVFPTQLKPSSTSPVTYATAIPIPSSDSPSSAAAIQTQQPVLRLLEDIYQPTEISNNHVTETIRKDAEEIRAKKELKPAPVVRPNTGLPTVTIKADFAPSGFSSDVLETPSSDDKRSRAAKGLFRGGVQIKNELQKYDTVTYVGFADFTTTVGNTVIVFMPKTAAQNAGSVTSITGEATVPGAAVATTVKTFLSHSDGMPTKTFQAKLSMRTSLPTVQADIRTSKAIEPVFATSSVATPYLDSSELESSSETTFDDEEIKPTETLPSRFVTSTTQVYNHGKKPLGLVKSIGVTEAVDGTTTLHTSFLYGTILKGRYTQLTQTATNIILPSTTVPPVTASVEPTTETEEISTTPEPEEVTDDFEEERREDIVEHTPTLVTKLIPTTVHKTFTYLTTFFIPGDDDSTSTSIRSREVISDEVKYLTTIFPEGEAIVNRDTIFPTAVTDSLQTEDPFTTTTEMQLEEEKVPTTEDSLEFTTEDSIQTESTTTESENKVTTERTFPFRGTTNRDGKKIYVTPHTNEESPVTTEDSPTEITTEETSEPPTTTENDEQQIELIFKTFYTTYTYFTTFFQETTTSVKSREVVATNVVTTYGDISFLKTDSPADLIEGAELSQDVEPTSTSSISLASMSTEYNPEDIFTSEINDEYSLEPTDGTPELSTSFPEQEELKTYTYYTTVFVDGETIVESRTEVQSVSPTDTDLFFRSASVDENIVEPAYEDSVEPPLTKGKRKPLYDTISRIRLPDRPTHEALIGEEAFRPSEASSEVFRYDTTMSRDDRPPIGESNSDQPIDTAARDYELQKEAMLALGVSPTEDSEAIETMVTDVTSSSSGGIIKRFDDTYSELQDQISSESNTDEIEPFSPTVVLQTSYTTFTYFTTVYKGTTSDIVSRLETVSNIVTETIRPTELEAKLSPEDATLPITYFTTFTYWTTLYKGTNTHITSREETISNIITPTVAADLATDVPLVTESVPIEAIDPTASLEPIFQTSYDLEPTTYYTTYTYFTTSYIDNDTIVNSHLETETNIVTPTQPPSQESTVQFPSDEVHPAYTEETVQEESVITVDAEQTPSSKLTGLISTIRSSEVNGDLTTLFNTDVYGTFIDGLYAQILESSTEVLTPTISPTATEDTMQPTGVVSLNEGKIVDADGVSTIFYTTKAIGTYIDDLYAQVIESTSSIKIDEEKKTLLPTDNLPTTVIGNKSFRTGLVRLIEGSLIKDKTTTFYESRVIGTLIDGRYAQIIESTSSFKVDMASTPVANIEPTSVSGVGIEPTSISLSSSPSPDVIESSLSEEDEEKEEDDDSNNKGKSRLSFTSKKNTFTPSIRPFASRPRPTFLPKKKTGDPATTITRTSFTPTVTAIPASKSSERGFGSSRNRFAANRKSSSSPTIQAEIKPTTSSGRRFSRPRTTSSTGGGYRSRSTSKTEKVQPTSTATSGYRGRGSVSFRSSSRPQISPSSSRFRVRPTAGFGGRFGQQTSTTPLEDLTNNDITGTTERSEESEPHTNSDEDQEAVVSTTTESSRRQNNPLLRFRRPPILQRTTTSTTTKKPEATTTRKSNLLRRPDARGNTGLTTPRPRPNPITRSGLRPRPSSSLFPPRGLFRKPSVEEEQLEEDKQGESEAAAAEEELKDNEFEGSETSEVQSSTTTELPKTERRGKTYNAVQIRPFIRRPARTRRQADWGSRSYESRYRRPVPRTVSYDYYDEEPVYERQPVVTEPPPPPTRQSRYNSRIRAQQPVQTVPRTYETTNRNYERNYERTYETPQRNYEPSVKPRIRPSPVTNPPRAQFTLSRERSLTTSNPRATNFRRPTTSSPRRRTSSENTLSATQRSRGTRYRAQTSYQQQQELTRNNARTRFTTKRPTRGRYRDNADLDSYTYSQAAFDGTITVTHYIPTEVTIPVVNGKNTEYKNVITAKPSLETLGPNQYTSSLGKDGKPTILLTTEYTSTNPAGFMEVTKYVVLETPTTSVTFTPTTLRGRKTSFSHVVPSTVYEVKPEVNTIQPNLGNAPLANLLLSQLLAGNLNLQNQGSQTPATPTTEFKTKTTTYVTTVTSFVSTVLPITFRGKEIKTTIVDSSSQVITATEFITETVVVTPTPVPQLNQINTLLLPALLQAQLLGQKQSPNPLLGPFQNDAFNQDEIDLQGDNDPLSRKKLDQDDSSVVTLYVSGKHPGEFSTILSTVKSGEESTVSVKKREVNYDVPKWNQVQISKIADLGGSFLEDFGNDRSPVQDAVEIESSEVETQSLESIVGDVSTYLLSNDFSKTNLMVNKASDVAENQKSSTGHFLWVSPAESAPDQRIGTIRSARMRRETDELPQRKRIRVRIPRKKLSDEVTTEMPLHEQEEEEEKETEHNKTNRRVRIYRKKLTSTVEPSDLVDSSTTEKIPETFPPARKSRVRVAKKRVKEAPSPVVAERVKLTVTRRRPVNQQTTLFPEESEDVSDMSTIYQYSVSGHQNQPSVTQVFMMASEVEDNPDNIPTVSTEQTASTNTNFESNSDGTEIITDYTDGSVTQNFDSELVTIPLPIQTTEIEPSETIQIQTQTTLYTTKTFESTRLRTFTYIVTRVSGTEQIITSTTTVKPHVQTVTVTEAFVQSSSSSGDDISNEGRSAGGQLLATKIMSNGVEVIVAAGGDTRTLASGPSLRILATASAARPIRQPLTLPPTVISEHVRMALPPLQPLGHQENSHNVHNEFVTKTYMTTYTYMTTFSEYGSTVVSSREHIISNVVTEEILPTRTRPPLEALATAAGHSDMRDHFTLTTSPHLTTGVYHTTYTYLNTLVDGEQPLVITSKTTVANTVTEQPYELEPSELPTYSTNTYTSTVAYTKTLSEGDLLKVVSTEDVLTRVIITESDYVPSTISQTPSLSLPAPFSTTDITKTYFVTYTYFKTLLENDRTFINSDIAISSDVVTEKYTIRPKKTQVISSTDMTMKLGSAGEDTVSPSNVIATKTYLTTFTYFTTLLQDNTSPSIIVKSRTKVVQNVVTETIDPGQINTEYLSLIHKYKGSAAIELNNVQPIRITATKEVNTGASTPVAELTSSFGDPAPPSVVTGSTLVILDHDDTQVNNNSSLDLSISDKADRLDKMNNTETKPSTTKPSVNQVNNFLKGLNALGPVINAMAGLIKGNMNKRKNETLDKYHYVHNPPQALVRDRPPAFSYPKSPVNIPSKSDIIADSETAESQHIDGANLFQELLRNKLHPPSVPASEASLLSGGIPISPGQVITANSDVIIGKPSVHGVRPPPNSAFKGEVEGMVPPPLLSPAPPPSAPPQDSPGWLNKDQDRLSSLASPNKIHSTQYLPEFLDVQADNKITPPSGQPSKPTFTHQHEFKGPPEFHKMPVYPTYPAKNDQYQLHTPKEPLPSQFPGPIGGNPPRIKNGILGPFYSRPPFGLQPHFNNYALKNMSNFGVQNQKPNNFGVQNQNPNNFGIHNQNPNNFGIHNQNPSNFGIQNQNPSRIHVDDTADLRPPSLPTVSSNLYSPNSSQTPLGTVSIPQQNYLPSEDQLINLHNTFHIPIMPPKRNDYSPEPTSSTPTKQSKPLRNKYQEINQHGPGDFVNPIPEPPLSKYERRPNSSSAQLLVNIQPSQVANVIIPPGGATTLVYDETMHQQSGPKGQIISEPSAYPDVKVGMHASAGLSTSERDSPPSWPREPLVIHNIANPQPYFPHGSQLEYFKPPPLRIHPDLSYNGEDDSFEDLDDPTDQIETEGGEVIQASNERPLRPGQLPHELFIKPSASVFGNKGDNDHTSRITVVPEKHGTGQSEDTSPNMHYSVVFSKPVQLDPQLSNHPVPIISGKPLIESPLSTGLSFKIEKEKQNFSEGSFKPMTGVTSSSLPSGAVVSQKEVTTPPPTLRPRDETIATMNMDEKPPKPTFESNIPQQYSRPLKESMSSPRPFTAGTFDRNSGSADEAVLGLAPPPPPTKPPVDVRPTSKRPFGPVRKRPIPPYKFERPEPLDTRLTKPSQPLPENNRRPPLSSPIPAEILFPSRPSFTEKKRITRPPTTERVRVTSFFTSTTPIPTTVTNPKFNNRFTTPFPSTTTQHSINPVLGGSLKVTEELGHRPDVITADSKVTSNVITGKPIGQVGTKSDSHIIFTGKPTQPSIISPTKVQRPKWPIQSNVITGSETIFFDFESVKSTSALDVSISPTDLVSKGVTTIFQDTRPTKVDTKSSPTKSYSTLLDRGGKPSHQAPVRETKIIITHTKTLTVTSTQSTVIRSQGMKPSTHTLVITKTLTSMILDTVTEVHTLIKPTNILSTVTTTMPPSTTTHTVYPSPASSSPPPPSILTAPEENDSILVVMTDKNTKNKISSFSNEPPPEIEEPEVPEAAIAHNVLLASIGPSALDSECRPGCKATRNELCQKIDNVMRCVCRPGFARMFPDTPCKPTYTYKMELALEKVGRNRVRMSPALGDPRSSPYRTLSEAAREGLDRLAMQSELRDIFHGVVVTGFSNNPAMANSTRAKFNASSPAVNFYLQLSDNTEEGKIQDIVKKYLMTNNYSLGGTDVYASKESAQSLIVEDFDECSDRKYHDCSENAQCFNLKGTYTCSCKDGFVDISHNTLFPGRLCSGEMIGCERCNFHGSCYSRDDEEICECFQWYAGESCHINLKVVLLILVLIGVSLLVLMVVCAVLSCMKPGGRNRTGVTVVPVRPAAFRPTATMASDKRAMIAHDSSSESSEHHSPPPYIKQVAQVMAVNGGRGKPNYRKASKAPSPPTSAHSTLIQDKDRSLTVMIPRAKYRPAPQPLVTMSTFGPEQKLLNYLHSDNKTNGGNSRKPSNSTNHSQDSIMKPKRPPSPIRKQSTGALVSAGYEVSATVGRTKELDECFIPQVHTDLSRPAFSTIRTVESSIVLGIQAPPTFEAELLDSTNRTNMMTAGSQSRSYNETMIHPPTKPYYSSNYPKHNTACSTDENHTMVERDVGSSYTMTQSHLYKSERGAGSDLSNFDSL